MDIHSIINTVSNVGSNSISVFGGNYEGGYQLQQDPVEISQFILDLLNTKIENYLEIGVAAGGTTRLLCDFLQIHNVYLIDLGEHPSIVAAYDNNIANLKNSGELHTFKGDSHSKEADQWLNKCNVKFDLVFIDGDHSYNGVLKDTMLAKKYAKKDTLFVYHDHACVYDVGQVIANLQKTKDFTLFKTYVNDGPTKKGVSLFIYKG